jgi:hypothetical protein
MSALTMAGLRQAVAARIAGLGGTWNQAPVPFDAHSWSAVPEAVPASKAHLSFSLGMGVTRAVGNRHRTLDGVRCETELPVRFLARLVPGTVLASLDVALGFEVDLIKRLDSQWSPNVLCYWLRSERVSAPTGEWFRSDCVFTVGHLLALA